MLKQSFALGPVATNCIILACEEKRVAVCIDAPQGSCSVLRKFLTQNNLSLQALWLTHSHWDHIFDAAAIHHEFDVPVFVHSLDKDNVLSPGVDGLHTMSSITPVKEVQEFSGGSSLSLASYVFQVIHTPGHTAGGSCFYCEQEKLLISGDTLFQGTFGRLDLPTACKEDMKKSLHQLATLPHDTLVFAGHGPTTTIGSELSWLSEF